MEQPPVRPPHTTISIPTEFEGRPSDQDCDATDDAPRAGEQGDCERECQPASLDGCPPTVEREVANLSGAACSDAPIYTTPEEATPFAKKLEELRLKRRDRIPTVLLDETKVISSVPLARTTTVPLMPSTRETVDDVEGEHPLPGGDEEEDELLCQPCEEGVQPKTGRDPRCPTAHERAEHELTHLQFRSWCRACVAGRLDNKPHAVIQRDHEIPTVLFDYGFVCKTGDSKTLTLLITKDRESRAIIADVAMHKGRGEEEVIQQAA